MSQSSPQVPKGPSQSMFLYAAACAVLLLGILGAVSVGSGETCPSGYFASDGTCISMSGMLGGPGNPNNPGQMVPSAPGPAPTKDEQLDVRTEIFLASAAVALIIASFAAKARRRDTAVVAAPAPPADAS